MSNQSSKRPPYPLISYTITTLLSDTPGSAGVFNDGKIRKLAKQIWSFTVISNDQRECVLKTQKLYNYLKYDSTNLNDIGIAVNSISSINNRDNFLTAEYEYREGFDVTYTFVYVFENSGEEGDGYIEHITLNKDTSPIQIDREDD